eukprot:gene19478-21401_t
MYPPIRTRYSKSHDIHAPLDWSERDLEDVCKRFGIEENTEEIIDQLGGGKAGKISFEDFCQNKTLFLNDMNTGQTSSSESAAEHLTDNENGTMNRNQCELLRKNQSKDTNQKSDRQGRRVVQQHGKEAGKDAANVNLAEYLDPGTLQQLENLQVISPGRSASREAAKGTDFLEIANRLHLAALTSLKDEIFDLNSRLHQLVAIAKLELVAIAKLELEAIAKSEFEAIAKLELEAIARLELEAIAKLDFEAIAKSEFEVIMMRVTELQSVIAELTRKLNETTGNKIVEEDEEIEESQCSSDLEAEEGSRGTSECCSENDEDDDELNVLPRDQVNYLAAASDVIETEDLIETEEEQIKKNDENCYDELSRVIGALECRIADRKKTKQTDVKQTKIILQNDQVQTMDETDGDNKRKSLEINLESSVEKSRQELILLEEQKRQLQKDIQQITVEEYVNRRAADTNFEQEINTLQKDREKLKNKLRKQEHELEDLKAANITIREEREQLRKRTRSLQDALEKRSSVNQSPVPCPSPTPSGGSNSRSNSLSRKHPYQTLSDSRRTSLQTNQSFQSSVSSPFVPVQTSKMSYSGGSPASTLQKQRNVGASSDLGSSVGDEMITTELAETLVRCLRMRIPETLLQTLLTYNKLDQILVTLQAHYSNETTEKTREMGIEIERLTSRLAHLKSQNDLLQLCLEESKGNCERLSLLVAKYESKDTALSIALQNTDQIVETYEVMLQLQESEQDMLVASYRNNMQVFPTDTMKSLTSTHSSKSNISGASSLTSNSHYQLTYGEDLAGDEEEGITMFRHSQTKRRDAEYQAKSLLQKLDRKYDEAQEGIPGGSLMEEGDDANGGYNSRTSTLSSANSSNMDSSLSKDDEIRLKEYVSILKNERQTVQTTVVELEGLHDVIEPIDDGNIEQLEVVRERNIDLETAVLLQELQALKEERAELKHRIYLLEKEKRSLELKLSSREAQEQAYIVHIEHLKSEVKEQIRKRKQIMKDEKRLKNSIQDDDAHSSASSSATPAVALSDLRISEEDIPADLHEAARREKKLKARIQELVETLEKLSKNSEIRHQQTAEYISDLKRANGALVSAYEKAKKRHASRLKKFEAQLITMAERHQEQMRILKERISKLEEDKKTPRNETSL